MKLTIYQRIAVHKLLILASFITFFFLFILDKYNPSFALYFFLLFTFTIGLFHGVLDITLLQREFSSFPLKPYRFARAVLIYALIVMVTSLLLIQSVELSLIALLLMTLWHFGEPYGRWEQSQYAIRLTVGGASVMLPLLISPHAMSTLVINLFTDHYKTIWMVWSVLAYTWLLLSAITITFIVLRRHKCMLTVLTECIILVIINALYSPLLAFALYFGVYHSGLHILRVRSTIFLSLAQYIHHKLRFNYLPIFATLIATIILVAFLWIFVHRTGHNYIATDTRVLHLIIVVLASVTAPHLILISRCSSWLKSKYD